MADITFEILNQQVQGTFGGQRVERFSAKVLVGENAKRSVLEPLDDTGWNLPGVITTMPDFVNNNEVVEVAAGMPAAHVVAVPSGRDPGEMTFTFQQPRLVLRWLARAQKAIPVVSTKATPPTLSSCTKTGGTISDATGIAEGTFLLIDTRDATKGGYPELTAVTSVSGTTLEWEPLDHAPADSTEAKIVNGWTEGTDETDTGIYIPNVISNQLVTIPILAVEYLPGLEATVLHHIPQFQIRTGNINYADNQKQMGFTGKCLVQPAASFRTDWNNASTTKSMPWYYKTYIVGSQN